MSSNLNVWISDEAKLKLDELLSNNKNGYQDEFLSNDRITRFRQILMRTTMSGLAGELLLLGLMVLENNMKDSAGKHKVDMTEYYEKVLFDISVCRKLLEAAVEVGEINHGDIEKQMNRIFRGSSDKYE
ncbi:hypothetical protein [Erwinia amylovora]|uniref:hypothetical protein n=1 Tax=Erwinia amylovora TaxID=552 RepID=UPI0020C02FE8|nr:hypothetical protein [Erwinia amylovora]MCK8417588.1 hypothetical protein [Erwinia amylovora]